jgi:hypothetical protein
MSVTIVESTDNSFKRGAAIAIRPYVEQGSTNMGLEKYNIALFDGIFHEEQLACLERNGIKQYMTGLNEFSEEVQNLSEDEREARIKEIRIMVVDLEKRLASNVIKTDDPEFWNKVKVLRPDNGDFWDKIFLRMSNDPLFLDPAKDPYDLIKVKAIEAGGFSLVAKSMEHARTLAKPPKFYLDRYEETAGTKTELKKLRNKALAELQKLFDKNVNKLMYVCKVIDPNSAQYRKSTPNDVMYDNLDRYINGESLETNKRRAAETFLTISDLSMEVLKLRAIIKDATYYKMISFRGDGCIYHMKSSTMMGRNPSDVLEFLKNPLNEQVLMDLTKSLEKQWNA